MPKYCIHGNPDFWDTDSEVAIVAVTAKGTGPQDRTGPQGRSRRGRYSTHRRPCGTSPNPVTLCDRSAEGSKSWHSGSFAKYSVIGHCHNFLPGVLCVAQGHRITSYGSWHAYEKKKTGLPTGMSHRTACGWSQVPIDSGPVRPCIFCSDPYCCYRNSTVGSKPI